MRPIRIVDIVIFVLLIVACVAFVPLALLAIALAGDNPNTNGMLIGKIAVGGAYLFVFLCLLLLVMADRIAARRPYEPILSGITVRLPPYGAAVLLSVLWYHTTFPLVGVLAVLTDLHIWAWLGGILMISGVLVVFVCLIVRPRLANPRRSD
jgi:hypothetical protein